ncbi:hypothetical protein [Algibacillus agarilyticus]|uniref:hypothetical protein n=1 Tax=Algibacillus agarilyticus TaxID=2234133 RepID=UPI000DCFF017|nr:hypothetical protein [Algibacillus agarilyticus]
MPNLNHKVEQLIAFFEQYSGFSIAVSGGIDSLLLAYLANRYSQANVQVLHAYSPAVPEAAMKRVKAHARQYGWQLKVVDAQEFNDPDYLKNPANRCFFCKSNLYQRISEHAPGPIFSGTNIDDLADYRPGLEAAKKQHVVHPYVEVGITKAEIYQIAKREGLSEIESLPAQPCLASRVETGISIKPEDLAFIDEVEVKTQNLLPNIPVIRCRITRQGVYLELNQLPESQLLTRLSQYLTDFCGSKGRMFSGVKLYQKGSAFLNGVKHA